MNYYNEFDPKAAAWLRELIKEKLIPNGHVDERSISEVQPGDLADYTQCHFFAGIGGWSLALELAGWPADRPCGTGSCPCQPYSLAGKGLGDSDPRNLWPVFFKLIGQCRKAAQRWTDCIFGEQVESAIKHGWLDGIQADLEGEGFAVGHCVLGAHSVGAPHIRQRLYWVAFSEGHQRHGIERYGDAARRDGSTDNGTDGVGPVANAICQGLEERGECEGTDQRETTQRGSVAGGLGNTGCQCDELGRGLGDAGHSPGQEQGEARQRERRGDAAGDPGADCGLELAESDGRQQRRAESSGRGAECGCGACRLGSPQGDNEMRSGQCGGQQRLHPQGIGTDLWGHFDLVPCWDGKARRIEPGSFPLAHGIPHRVGLLRGYGNAIVPQVATVFIKSFIEVSTPY